MTGVVVENDKTVSVRGVGRPSAGTLKHCTHKSANREEGGIMRIIGSGMASSALDTVRPESRWAQASVLVSWVALLCALVVGKTHASDASAPQDQSASAAALEEVTVTARRVSENLQRTPVSITAITSEDIDNRGVTSIGDLASEAPNVTLEQNTAGFGKSAIAFIRGVGQYDYLPAFEPGVGFYVDDVYQGTLFGSLVNLTDIGRVEVLRGPQGTLFGKDNEGGAVRFFSPQPTGDNSGSVEAGYGSYNRQQVKGSFDVALVPDQLFLRV